MANRKRNVSYVSQEEPAFLKKFKERVGYKEAPGVDAKFAVPDFDADDDTPETAEEQPQVVVLKKGDLTADEAAGLIPSELGDVDMDNPDNLSRGDTGGRIMFKKPTKKSTDDKSDLTTTSSGKKHKDSEKSTAKGQSEKNKNSKGKGKKNTKLLSFNDEEEEED